MKVAGAILAALLAGVLIGYCARGGVGSEALREASARADSAAEAARGMHAALLERIAWDAERLQALRNSADREVREARSERSDSERQVAEAGASIDATLAGVPGAAGDSARAQLAREREGRRGTVAALEREMEARVGLLTEERDTFGRQRDAALRALVEAHTALDSMTANRDEWREEAQKKGLNLGLFRVPAWAGYVVVAGGSLYVGSRL